MCFQEAEESRSAIEMFLKGSIKSVVCRRPVRKGVIRWQLVETESRIFSLCRQKQQVTYLCHIAEHMEVFSKLV